MRSELDYCAISTTVPVFLAKVLPAPCRYHMLCREVIHKSVHET